MIDLTDILPLEAIRVEASASDWPAAIRAAGELLVATGTATPEYTEAMIDNVRQNGPYIVVAPGFALAHTRPDGSVRHRDVLGPS